MNLKLSEASLLQKLKHRCLSISDLTKEVKKGNQVSYWPLHQIESAAAILMVINIDGNLLYLQIVLTQTSQITIAVHLLHDSTNTCFI